MGLASGGPRCRVPSNTALQMSPALAPGNSRPRGWPAPTEPSDSARSPRLRGPRRPVVPSSFREGDRLMARSSTLNSSFMRWLGCLGALVFASAAMGQPSNDSCFNAIPIGTGPAVIGGTTVGATVDGSTTCGFSNTTPDVWYSITVGCGGTLSVDTCVNPEYDTVLSIHSGCPGTAGNTLACNDDAACFGSPSLRSNVSAAVGPGTYLIRVSGFGGAVGNFVLSVFFSSAPGNDFCNLATSIGTGTFSGTTACATVDGSSTCGASNTTPDVWYSFAVPCDGTLVVDSCGSGYDTVLSIYSGCPGTASNQVACNDDAPSGPCSGTLQSLVSTSVTA